jgi:hypothetical protein
VNEEDEPRAASGLRRFAEGVRRTLARLSPSTNAAGAIEEYVRVVPVLAGQVREASSEIEDSQRAVRQLLAQSVKNAHLSMEAVERLDQIALGLRIMAFNAKSESSEAMADELSHHADQVAALAEGIRRTVPALESKIELAMNNESDCRVEQRLQHVVETLSEMQGDFVATLARPEERSAFSGAAAVRLRQRYTASGS